ncbi:hypothetical protein PFDG_04892, partial [Plasmodium falciparum Dd2]
MGTLLNLLELLKSGSDNDDQTGNDCKMTTSSRPSSSLCRAQLAEWQRSAVH